MDNPFKSLPKPVIIGGIAVTLGVTGFFLYRHHAATGSWFGGTAASSSAIDPVTGLATSQDNAIDPLTNEAYLAEAQQYGSVQAAEAAVSSFGTSVNSGTGTSTAFGQAGTSTLAAGAVAADTYTSNAAWDQAAIAGLEDISGGATYNGVDIASTLGSVLQGEPVTSAQLQVWNAAVGEFGQPPIPVSPVIQPATAPSTTTSGTAPTVTPKVTVPRDLIGQSQEAAFGILSAAGLHAVGTPVVKGKTLIVQSASPAEGTSVNKGSTVKLTSRVKA